MNDSASKGQMCLFYCNNLERLPLRGKRHLLLILADFTALWILRSASRPAFRRNAL